MAPDSTASHARRTLSAEMLLQEAPDSSAALERLLPCPLWRRTCRLYACWAKCCASSQSAQQHTRCSHVPTEVHSAHFAGPSAVPLPGSSAAADQAQHHAQPEVPITTSRFITNHCSYSGNTLTKACQTAVDIVSPGHTGTKHFHSHTQYQTYAADLQQFARLLHGHASPRCTAIPAELDRARCPASPTELQTAPYEFKVLHQTTSMLCRCCSHFVQKQPRHSSITLEASQPPSPGPGPPPDLLHVLQMGFVVGTAACFTQTLTRSRSSRQTTSTS